MQSVGSWIAAVSEDRVRRESCFEALVSGNSADLPTFIA